jgi:hypothetical protein
MIEHVWSTGSEVGVEDSMVDIVRLVQVGEGLRNLLR